MADLDALIRLVYDHQDINHDTTVALTEALAELQRHRSTQAADKERIKAVVTALLHLEIGACFTPSGAVEIIERVATRAAEQLATAAVADVHDDRIHGEVQMLRDLGVRGASAATYAVLAGAVRAAYGITHVQANGESSDVLDVLLKALASVPQIALAAHRSQP